MKRLAALLAVFAVIFAWAGSLGVLGLLHLGDEATLAVIVVIHLTILVAGGIIYFAVYFWRMRKLDIPSHVLEENELIWAKTAQGVVHYESGNPFKFWEAVGGKLFLTNKVLEFRSNPAEFFAYRRAIPLKQIICAEPCRLFGIIPGALRLWLDDGTVEMFTFGAVFDLSKEWAEAIIAFRDDVEKT